MLLGLQFEDVLDSLRATRRPTLIRLRGHRQRCGDPGQAAVRVPVRLPAAYPVPPPPRAGPGPLRGSFRCSSPGAACAGRYRWRRRSRSRSRPMPALRFPVRDLIIFLTFCVILATLVLQGLTIAGLIRTSRHRGRRRERARREQGAHAPRPRRRSTRMDELFERGLGARGHGRAHACAATTGGGAVSRHAFDGRGDDGDYEERSADYQRLRRELLEAPSARRSSSCETRGVINDEVMRRVQQRPRPRGHAPRELGVHGSPRQKTPAGQREIGLADELGTPWTPKCISRSGYETLAPGPMKEGPRRPLFDS